jgi:hypothetical protein
MLKANKISGHGFGKASQFEVTAAGARIGTINDNDSTFELDGQGFQIARSGVFARQLRLMSGDTLIATASQRPLRNHYLLSFGGKEWTFKAIVLLSTQFGLFENETPKGTVSAGPYLDRLKDITADLPDEMPREIQMFPCRF